MKIEDLKTEKIIKLFGLQSGCMSEKERKWGKDYVWYSKV